MAAPPEVTTENFTGTFVMNKTLSDSSDRILELQGIGWFMRKAIGFATITLHVKHYKDDKEVEHIDIKQTLTGGIEGSDENRTVDWTERSRDDKIFGPLISKSRRVKVEDIDNEFLKKGWLPDTIEHGAIDSRATSETAKSGRIWTAEQIWGFEEITGERRHVRHVNFTSDTGGDHENIQAKLIYDYVGELKE